MKFFKIPHRRIIIVRAAIKKKNNYLNFALNFLWASELEFQFFSTRSIIPDRKSNN